jgi:nitrite reductase/ring-hydroxylating ferredoxin subunit
MSPATLAWQRICPAPQLRERDEGVRGLMQTAQGSYPVFVLRIDGVARAWLNQCAHVGIELDWLPGRFLDDRAESILCAAHGASYDPVDGRCRAGPCRGRGLKKMPCREHAGWIEVQPLTSFL